MKNLVVTCLGIWLVLAAGSVGGWAAVVQFDGSSSTDFLDPTNWDDNAAPTVGNQYIINDNLTATYTTNVATSVSSLIVGADWPVTGDLGTAGTLNMSTGSLTVTGGGNAFQVGRACCAGDGIVNLSGDAALVINGTDPVVGARDRGELNLSGSASVTSPSGYWRLGNYGPDVDSGLQGDGLLSVTDNATFSAMVIFLGDSDSDGELRVSGNGSVTLTDNLVPNVATNRPDRSSLVHMIGSSATLTALNLESFNGAAEVHNQYRFTADASGVSPIVLSNAVNIGNNDLTVDLTSYALPVGSSLLLFDAAANQIYGDGPNYFDGVAVLGVSDPSEYKVVYDLPNGDISLVRVPEPSTALLAVMGLVALCSGRRVER